MCRSARRARANDFGTGQVFIVGIGFFRKFESYELFSIR